MDIYTYIINDHRAIAILANQIPAARSAGERLDQFDCLKDALELHSDIEAKVFYRTLIRKGDHHLLVKERQAEIEHDAIRKAALAVDHADAGSAEWIIHFNDFIYVVEQHFQHEETEIFAQARAVLSPKQASELATEIDALKRQRINQRAAARQRGGDFISRMFGRFDGF